MGSNIKKVLTNRGTVVIIDKYGLRKYGKSGKIGGRITCLFVPKINPLRQEETAAEQIGR